MNIENSSPVASSNKKSSIDIYIASAFGAFCLGFGDLLINEDRATVLKISEVIRQYLYTKLGDGGLISLILLVLLGGFVSWVYQPHTHVDAFGRGFAVFALLTAITPLNTSPGSLSSITSQSNNAISWLSVFPTAYAQNQDSTITTNAEIKDKQSGKATIVLSTPTGKDNIRNVTVTVRNPSTAKIIAAEHVYGDVFTLQKPVGTYLIEIESPNYKRIRTDVKIVDEAKEYSLPIEKTKVPMFVQRLFSPKEVELKEASSSSTEHEQPH